MNDSSFIAKAKALSLLAAEDLTGQKQEREGFEIVWFAHILSTNKCLVANTRSKDTLYHEITYNPAKDEIYIDSYEKTRHKVMKHAES